jgi:hypothetical protein
MVVETTIFGGITLQLVRLHAKRWHSNVDFCELPVSEDVLGPPLIAYATGLQVSVLGTPT